MPTFCIGRIVVNMTIFFLDFFLLFIYCSIVAFVICGIFRRSAASRNRMSWKPSVTVIIAAKNEEKHIGACLIALSGQTYDGQTEFIIIDDQSTDNTRKIVTDFIAGKKNWRVFSNQFVSRWLSNKKGALATAIQHSNGDLLFFTDADCIPVVTWIEGMVEQFYSRTVLNAGFSPLHSIEKNLWNEILFVFSLADALIASGTIGWNVGFTCTGRNLAYRRVLLNEIGGYDALPDSLSGDDDFILQAASRLKNWEISYTHSPRTLVTSQGPKNWSAFLKQKKRHLSAGKYYPLPQKFFYTCFHICNYGIGLLAIFCFWLSPFFVGIILIKLLIDWIGLHMMARKFDLQLKFLPFLCWQALFPLYHLWCFPAALKGKMSWVGNHMMDNHASLS